MNVQRRVLSLLSLAVILLSPVEAAEAAWIASGTFRYQDREFDEDGFTGVTPYLPIRQAKVEVRYVKGGGGTALLASGATDATGNFSITVNDTTTRDIVIRALTTGGVPDLFLQVTNINGPSNPYAVTTPTYTAHAPVNLNAGIINAAIGGGGEVFNLFDVGLNTMDFLAYLNGSRPSSSQQLTIQWEAFGAITVNSYIGGNTVRAADNSAYNDTVIQHESAHYAIANFSASDSPGGVHHLTNCRQDLRLAFDEGFATFFGQSVRRHFGLPHPQLYVKTSGGAGAGNLDFYFDLEAEVPYTCSGSSSEVTVYAALWDMADGALTPDSTPGFDEYWDTLALTDTSLWDVMRSYIPTALNKSMEDYWDGWFVMGKGSDSAMKTMFIQHGLEFVHDTAEENDSPVTARAVAPNGIPVHATYFKDLGNGAGTVDTDYFKFNTVAGLDYRIETTRLLGDANTALVLLGSDGVTPVLSNDDRSAGDKSSYIFFSSPNSATYYLKSYHGSGLGIYGSYDLSIIGGSVLGGSVPTQSNETPQSLRKRVTTDGQTPGSGSESPPVTILN